MMNLKLNSGVPGIGMERLPISQNIGLGILELPNVYSGQLQNLDSIVCVLILFVKHVFMKLSKHLCCRALFPLSVGYVLLNFLETS